MGLRASGGRGAGGCIGIASGQVRSGLRKQGRGGGGGPALWDVAC